MKQMESMGNDGILANKNLKQNERMHLWVREKINDPSEGNFATFTDVYSVGVDTFPWTVQQE
jgi:hypothetical protein